MKKILIVLLLLVLMTPMYASAKEKEKINVYIFYGDGCPHCHNAFNFFDSIEKEYGKYFNIVKYETWYSHQNSKLLASAAEEMKTDSANLGVPYIVIGDKTFLGYAESYNEDIKKAIVESYNNDKYVDRLASVVNSMKKDNLVTFLTAGIACLFLLVIVVLNFVLRKKFNTKELNN